MFKSHLRFPYFIVIANTLLWACSALTYRCGGVSFTPSSANQCQDMRPSGSQFGQPSLRDMACPTNRQWGCEQYTDVAGTRTFYCCPQLCDETQPNNQIRIGVDERCNSQQVCQSDSSKVCKQVSTGDYYCCSSTQSQPGANANPNQDVTGQTTANCQDTVADCPSRADLCMVVETYEKMYRECPKTCNVCGDCQDLGTDCPNRKQNGYCDRTIYADLMNWQCPLSCNRCNNRPPPTGSLLRVRGRRR